RLLKSKQSQLVAELRPSNHTLCQTSESASASLHPEPIVPELSASRSRVFSEAAGAEIGSYCRPTTEVSGCFNSVGFAGRGRPAEGEGARLPIQARVLNGRRRSTGKEAHLRIVAIGDGLCAQRS